MKNKMTLACDLGGTNLRMAAVTDAGKILHLCRAETPKTSDPEAVVRLIAQTADECRRAAREAGAAEALAAAVPATVNVREGLILKAPNVPALDGFRFSAAVSERLALPVVLENDANAAAIGEQAFGAAKEFQSVIVVTLGTGVGGGIIIDGKILRGVDGTAGEIGHICVERGGAPCGCGSRGCVEQYASATAITRLARELAKNYPGSVLQSNPQATALDIYRAGLAGDALALKTFERAGNLLGAALADLVNVLNPEAIVIGGGVSSAWDLLVPHVSAEIHRHAFREPAERVKILRAQLDKDVAGILGAAKTAFDFIDNGCQLR